MMSWIIFALVLGGYVLILYLTQRWMNEHIHQDHWWDKYPSWLAWSYFALWFPVLALALCVLRSYALSRYLFTGEEYDDTFADDIPDFG